MELKRRELISAQEDTNAEVQYEFTATKFLSKEEKEREKKRYSEHFEYF